MKADWVQTIAPIQEPITLTDVKLHCRALADVADEDPVIAMYAKGARLWAEHYTSRAFFTQTYRLEQDDFTREIWLPRAAPLQSVTSVKYYDTDGVQQTLATTYYRVDTTSEPGRVVLKPGQSWPSVQCERGQAVEVIYVAGWSTVQAIPDDIRVGICWMADHLYEHRSGIEVGAGITAVEVPMGIASFLSPYKVYWREPVCA